MNKPELTPFDWETVGMIENLIKKPVTVAEDLKNNLFEIYWPLDPNSENYEKMHNAILEAIKGKAGERYLGNNQAGLNITSIQFDPESYPYEKRYEMTEPKHQFGKNYYRLVLSRKFTNEESEVWRLSEFVGGGTHTVPKNSDPATFEFPNQDGITLKVKEGDYVVLENGQFSVVEQKEFEKHYTLNH